MGGLGAEPGCPDADRVEDDRDAEFVCPAPGNQHRLDLRSGERPDVQDEGACGGDHLGDLLGRLGHHRGGPGADGYVRAVVDRDAVRYVMDERPLRPHGGEEAGGDGAVHEACR